MKEIISKKGDITIDELIEKVNELTEKINNHENRLTKLEDK